MDVVFYTADGRPQVRHLRHALSTLSKADPRLGALIRQAGDFQLELNLLHNPYRALARAIIYQQITGSAARSIWEKTRLHFGARTFPTPDQLLSSSVEELRTCGLSRGKAMALLDLALKTREKVVPSFSVLHKLPDEAIIERLTEVRGVGIWTVQMLLIFRMGRMDVMPSTDYGVRKGFGRWFLRGALPTPKQVEARGETWRPYRSIASWYLWRAAEMME